MDEGRKRLEHLRGDPRVALDVLDESDWHTHVSITGHVEEMREDRIWPTSPPGPAVHGQSVPQRDRGRISAWITVDGWYGWGALKDSSQPG